MKYLIKYIIVAAWFMCAFSSPVIAQNVSYMHKLLTPEGCTVNYRVVKNESDYFIIVSVRSEKLSFLNNPTMKIRTFNDDVITLNGINVRENSESLGLVTGNLVLPITEITSTAQFSITEEELQMLKDGIEKIRLSMIPKNHERVFKKDKIGRKLYQFYLDIMEEDEGF